MTPFVDRWLVSFSGQRALSMIFDRCHGALQAERVIDSALRPELAPPSDRRGGSAEPTSIAFVPGMTEVGAIMLSGVSAFGKFVAARKQYHGRSESKTTRFG